MSTTASHRQPAVTPVAVDKTVFIGKEPEAPKPTAEKTTPKKTKE